MRGRRRRRRAPLRPSQVAVKLKLPFLGEISGTWEPGRAEAEAAWELYVELITRVTVVELRPDEGVLREALSSLYTLFPTTREILRKYGPEVAPRTAPGSVTFGILAVGVLNGALRPLLTRWHPALQAWEARRDREVDPLTHERSWDRHDALRADVAATRATLAELARVLADVAGADYLLPELRDGNPAPTRSGGGYGVCARHLTLRGVDAVQRVPLPRTTHVIPVLASTSR
ncbi:hypothetical protein SAMN05421810_101846 [Amycolatopsis arida]|uniref:Uncharacterized protein n=1 Tax=Amycolatopsis arida TaxID=587909 RepID=A0A1I5M9I8_9PSEU|nr:hypothetical protein [Amycolatopsis arida]TDX94020.1 hypothetical protein CLV69_104478 [Amycolatopsis arida]SFP06262.1 hypothetical protein SAMN05421810_101846 [Amycolatopsis arida]